MNKQIGKSLFWKLLERFGVQGTQFILQIVLARILDPAHYGVLSLMIVFTSLANVFIQTGFNTSLVQNKDVTNEDYSSVFWVTLGIACILYVILFVAAPFIATFYGMPEMVAPMRVLALMLLPGALNSVQLAKASREMDFRKVFLSNIGGSLFSGVVGVVIALMGGGLWALVAQTMLNVLAACVIMAFTVKLKLRLACNWNRIKVLFRFGWKLLVSGLLNTLYTDLRSLVIGKKYTEDTLGYYNRGKQFPQFVINAIDGAVQSVIMPAMASEQDDKIKVKLLMRNSVTISAYIIFPMMAGLAGVATSLVQLLLTEKWLPCVPYLRIYCFSLAFYPVHSSNLQAINAMGRSDIFLKLEIVKKIYGLVALVVAVFCFESPIAIAMTGIFTTVISCFVNASPNKKLIDYSYIEQMRDIVPSLLLSFIMLGCVLAVELLNLNSVMTLLVQVLVGVIVYMFLSAVLRLEPFRMLLQILKK